MIARNASVPAFASLLPLVETHPIINKTYRAHAGPRRNRKHVRKPPRAHPGACLPYCYYVRRAGHAAHQYVHRQQKDHLGRAPGTKGSDGGRSRRTGRKSMISNFACHPAAPGAAGPDNERMLLDNGRRVTRGTWTHVFLKPARRIPLIGIHPPTETARSLSTAARHAAAAAAGSTKIRPAAGRGGGGKGPRGGPIP